MTFDFARVNWLYLLVAIALWMVVLVVRWRMGSASSADQYFSRTRGSGDAHMSPADWFGTPSDEGGPGEGDRVKAVVTISFAFWAILLWFLVFGLNVVRWR